MTKGKTLQDRLAQSLDQANTRERKGHRQAPTLKTPGGNCTKLSISLFKTDMDKLQAIRSYMATRGAILSTSQAVKLALRTASLSDELSKALDQARKEDGRKW